MIPFSVQEFLAVLENYNLAIWPLQIFAYILVLPTLFFSSISKRYSIKIVLAILSFFWLFTGIVFCFIYWAPSHIFGYIFGICCVIQGLLFLYSIYKSDITMGSRNISHLFVCSLCDYWISDIWLLYRPHLSKVFCCWPCTLSNDDIYLWDFSNNWQ